MKNDEDLNETSFCVARPQELLDCQSAKHSRGGVWKVTFSFMNINHN